jgi:hypothetical protein
MKTFKSIIRILTVFIFLLGLSSCENNMNKDEDNNTVNTQKIKKELSQEQRELKEEVKVIIANFDKRIGNFKASLERRHITLTDENKKELEKLEKQRNDLKQELNSLASESEKNWTEYKEKIKQQTQSLTESIEEFFAVNKEE